MEAFPIVCCDVAEFRLAQVQRFVQYRIEHRGEIVGRRIDDLQHLGGCGLLLQCLATPMLVSSGGASHDLPPR
jgi:hypothetical protein